MKLRLKWWVKDLIKVIIILILIYTIIGLFTKKEVIITEGKNYTCNGTFLLKFCGGETYD